MPVKICYICPTYNATELHDYTLRSLHSFFRTTADGCAIVVDDGSAGWSDALCQELLATPLFSGQEIHLHHFPEWGGLTRSWNKGLELAHGLQVDYVCPSNNDIVFTEEWYAGLLHALEHGYALAGPVSNAPGTTAAGKAEVWRYLDDYQTNDDQAYLDKVSRRLRKRYLGRVEAAPVNGFFQIGKMSTFRAGMYDGEHYYRPVNKFNSRGSKNPTPLMTLNEDELQGRWARIDKKGS
jgi:glycosyltransferase involved in cell wall biosynthesis